MNVRTFASGLRLPALFALGAVILAWPLLGHALADTTVVTATPGTSVTIPTGDIATNALDVLQAVALVAWSTVAGILIRFLPQGIQAALHALLTPLVIQIVNRGIAYGFNSVRGVVVGQTLTVDAGSAVVAYALNYIFGHGWPWLLKWAGGAQGITEKILATLHLEADATAPEVVAALPLAQKQLQLVPPAI